MANNQASLVPRTSNVLILTAGFGRFYLASKRLELSIKIHLPKTDVVAIDLQAFRSIMNEVGSAVSGYEGNVRGFNYWRWKPILINYFLDKGYKSILYLDAGCEVNPCILDSAIRWFRYETDFLMLLTRTGTSLKQYTKPGVLDFFKISPELAKAEMLQFGIIFMKANDKVKQFFCTAAEYALSSEHSYLFNDELEAVDMKRNHHYVAHRHDQSVLNLLMHKNFSKVDVGVVNSTLEPYQAELAWLNPPILAARNSKGISIYRLLQEHGLKSQIPKYKWVVVKLKNLLLRLSNGNTFLMRVTNGNFSNYSFSKKQNEFSSPVLSESPIEYK